MTRPNEQLMDRYGTRGFWQAALEKRASLTDTVGPIASALALAAQSKHDSQVAEEAQMLNDLFRELEARRQAAIVSGLKGSGALSVQGQASQSLKDMEAYQRAMALMKNAAADLGLLKRAGMGAALGSAAGGLAKALKPGWKTKAMLGAGGLAAGYGAMKTMGGIKDYMMTPNSTAHEWGGQGKLKSQVNEFGY